MYISHLLLLLLVIYCHSYNEYHMHSSRKVEDAIKRYSREATLEIDKIKKKLFVRKSAGEESLKTASESTKFKYGIILLNIFIDIIFLFNSLNLKLNVLVISTFINITELRLSALVFACHYKLAMLFAGLVRTMNNPIIFAKY